MATPARTAGFSMFIFGREIRAKFLWNQWVLGVAVDGGRIIPVRWFVLFLGPLTITLDITAR